MHNSNKSSWKDNIITENPENDSNDKTAKEDQPVWKKELKADIVEIIGYKEIENLEQLQKELDYGKWLIKTCLKELKHEQVIEVEQK